jgi:putative aldouronate transport system substrate-binding protein
LKKSLKLVTVLFLTLSLVVGCSSGNNGGNTAKENTAKENTATNTGTAEKSEPVKNEEKIKINIAAQYWSGPKWADNHPTIQYLNEKFNVDIKLDLINGPEYFEKLKVMAASGKLPDFYRVDAPTYLAWQNEGAYVDLTEWVPKYANLSEAYPSDHKAMTVLNPEGELYGLPEISWIVRDTVQIRKDWLDNVGIALPTADEFTVDKFYEIAKAFATGDPDKNGINGDTIGFANEIGALKHAYGLANEWIEKDGQLVPHQMQVEEYKLFLTFMNRAYKEGVLDQDFVMRKNNEIHDMRKSNKLGLFTYHNNYTVEVEDNVKKTFPETNPEVVAMAPPIGPTGLRGNGNMGFGMNKQVINAQADEAKIDRILQILDWWVTEEGTQIMKNGVEGVHYKKNAEGKWEVTDRWEPEMPRFLNSNLFKRPGTDFNFYLWTDEEEIKRNLDYKALAEQYPWPNAAMGLEFYSDAYISNAANLNVKFQEAIFKIILGSEPIDYIEKASAEWFANGGEQIVKDINEAAKK